MPGRRFRIYGKEFKEAAVRIRARAGIAECWLVDVVNETVEVQRNPEVSSAARYGWRYRSVETLRGRATVRPLIAPDAPIPASDLQP